MRPKEKNLHGASSVYLARATGCCGSLELPVKQSGVSVQATVSQARPRLLPYSCFFKVVACVSHDPLGMEIMSWPPSSPTHSVRLQLAGAPDEQDGRLQPVEAPEICPLLHLHLRPG